jgi:hypothetical protein
MATCLPAALPTSSCRFPFLAAQLIVWDIAHAVGKPLAQLPGHQSIVYTCCFAPVQAREAPSNTTGVAHTC